MIRRIATQLVSLSAFLVFQGMALVDARGAHGCAHHDAIPAAPTGSILVGASADHSAHAGHLAELHGEADADAGHGEHDGPCTCLGDCASGPNAPVASSVDAARFAPIAGAIERATTPHVAEELPGAPPFLLPYAQGPPPVA